MRVDPSGTTHAAVMTYRRNHTPAPPSPPAPTHRADTAELSGEALSARRAQAAVTASSEVRAEKVAAIKAQVQAGTYQVDTHALAEKLLKVL